MSQRAFAKRLEVSHVTVNRAIKSGRLSKSVDSKGRIVDVELAIREWAANTDHSTAPATVHIAQSTRRRPPPEVPAPQPPPDLDEDDETEFDGSDPIGWELPEAVRQEKIWKAKTAELKYREAAGELIPAAQLRATVNDAFAACRAHLLGIPSRVVQSLPHLATKDVAVMERLIREALESLSEVDAS